MTALFHFKDLLYRFRKYKAFHFRMLVIFCVMCFSSYPAFCQDYLRISGTKKVFRYFPSSKKSDENIGDSVIVSIKRQNNSYKIILINNSKVIANCLYSYTGKNVVQSVKTRIRNERGSKIVSKKITVKLLTPQGKDCLVAKIPNL